MKAYLIDPKEQTVTQVEYTGDYTNIYTHIEADLFDVARLYRNGDGAFVDDEGLLKEPDHFWVHRNYAQPLAGRGLVLGVDDEGNSVEPKTTLEELTADVFFVSREELLLMQAMQDAITAAKTRA